MACQQTACCLLLSSAGVTLKENNLREIEGGRILESQGVLVANRRSLLERPAQLLPVLHELLERLDAHLKAEQFYSGTAAVLCALHYTV
jgi:ATP phosphoribosyltransferase